MGQFALGRELDELTAAQTSDTSPASSMSFHACYHELFEPDGVGQLLIAINSVVPIRWLPLDANRRFKQAHKMLRSQIQAVIDDRIRALDPGKVENAGGKDHISPRESNDLLTWMVARKYYTDDTIPRGRSCSSDGWSKAEIRDQVRLRPCSPHFLLTRSNRLSPSSRPATKPPPTPSHGPRRC